MTDFVYTRELPTVPGDYRYRKSEEALPRWMKVYAGYSCQGLLAEWPIGTKVEVATLHGLWAGPYPDAKMPEPEKPAWERKFNEMFPELVACLLSRDGQMRTMRVDDIKSFIREHVLGKQQWPSPKLDWEFDGGNGRSPLNLQSGNYWIFKSGGRFLA